jgi:hypothetical protein
MESRLSCTSLGESADKSNTGMATIWVVGDAEEIATIPLSVSETYFTYGGSVYGNETHAPAVYHYFDDGTDECVAGGGDGGDDAEGDDTGEARRRPQTWGWVDPA